MYIKCTNKNGKLMYWSDQFNCLIDCAKDILEWLDSSTPSISAGYTEFPNYVIVLIYNSVYHEMDKWLLEEITEEEYTELLLN